MRGNLCECGQRMSTVCPIIFHISQKETLVATPLLRTASDRCRIVVTTACRPTMKGKSPLIKCRHLCLQEQASQQEQSNPTPWLHDVQIMVWEGCSTAWQGGDQTTPPCRYVWGPEKDLNSAGLLNRCSMIKALNRQWKYIRWMYRSL